MVESIKSLDLQLFLFLNDIHNSFFDVVMYYVTDKEFWFPFYIAIIALLFWKMKWRAVPVLVAVAMVIVLCDQTTSGFMKPFFERLRPCHDPEVAPLVHLVTKCGGQYSFASSHASNTFGFATLFWLLFRHDLPKITWILAWSGIVSYSRIYVGVHYPLDIVVGAMVGLGYGWLVYFTYGKVVPLIYRNQS